MTTEKRQPIKKLRDGLLESAIWKNPTEKGHFYSATINNSYVDDNEQFHSSNNYSDTELLQLARLANKTYDAIVELRQADKAAKAS